MKLEYVCTVEKSEEIKVPQIYIFHLKGEKGEKIKLELPVAIVNELPPNAFQEGRKVRLVISTEKLNPNDWPLLMTGYVYLKKKENDLRKTFISIGGLILRLDTSYDINFEMMQKVDIGVTFI